MFPNDLKQIDNILNKRLDKHHEELIREIILAIEESEAHINSVADKTKADKEDLENLKVRVD